MRIAISAFALVFLGASAAYAQTAPNPDQLFSDGVALMGAEKYDEALVKLEEAERLDPGIGTQFNIGICYAKLGKLGTAWRNFTTVQQLAHASGKTAREESAHAKLDELRPLLSVVTITVADGAETTVKIDDAELARGDWASYPVDPGAHRVEATAPTRVPFRTSFDAPAAGQQVTVAVPVLASSKEVVTVTHETTNTRRALGLAIGGVGVAGVVVATVTGILLIGDKRIADRSCKPQCLNKDGTFDQSAADAVDRGTTLLPINLVAWLVAGAGLGAGTYLLLTSTKKVTPVVAAHGGGVMVSGDLF